MVEIRREQSKGEEGNGKRKEGRKKAWSETSKGIKVGKEMTEEIKRRSGSGM